MAMQEAMEDCFLPCYIIYSIIYKKWCMCLSRTSTAFMEENHAAFILCWLQVPTKLAEWIGVANLAIIMGTCWEFHRKAMLIGGRWVSSMPIMPSLRTTWFLERLVTFKPLELFSGSVNYTMAKQRLAVTPLTFQSIDFGDETHTGRCRFHMLCII
jgi:hypothetical protein